MLAVKVLPKGQITLPKEVRQKLHIQVGTIRGRIKLLNLLI